MADVEGRDRVDKHVRHIEVNGAREANDRVVRSRCKLSIRISSRSGDREDRASESTDASEAIDTGEAIDVIRAIDTEAKEGAVMTRAHDDSFCR